MRIAKLALSFECKWQSRRWHPAENQQTNQRPPATGTQVLKTKAPSVQSTSTQAPSHEPSFRLLFACTLKKTDGRWLSFGIWRGHEQKQT